MNKDLLKSNPALIVDFLLKSLKEKAVQKNKQRTIDYFAGISTTVSSELFDNVIGLANQRLDEIEIFLSNLFKNLDDINNMEIEKLVSLLDNILIAINSWDLKEAEHATIIQMIKESLFNY